MISVTRNQLRDFLRDISVKYLPEHLCPRFKVTGHFMERLEVDRSETLSPRWVSELFTELFRNRLCEFLYIMECTEDRGRICLQYQGKTVALVKHKGFTIQEYKLILTTCFKGVAMSPEHEYYVLSLDTEVTP